MVQETPFDDISFLELCQSFFSGAKNHLRNFGREHHEEHLEDLAFETKQPDYVYLILSFASKVISVIIV